MNSEEFRKLMVEMVKASGQEIVDRAEDLVGNGDLLTDFDIRIRFPVDSGTIVGVPTIELTKSYMAKGAIDTITEYCTKDSKGE